MSADRVDAVSCHHVCGCPQMGIDGLSDSAMPARRFGRVRRDCRAPIPRKGVLRAQGSTGTTTAGAQSSERVDCATTVSGIGSVCTTRRARRGETPTTITADRGSVETFASTSHIGGRRNLMPGAYSTDLRERVLVAVEAGAPADAVADEFMVGRSSVYRWMAAARDEGRRVATPRGHGPKPLIRDQTEVALCRLLDENNHLTLVECRDRLAADTNPRKESLIDVGFRPRMKGASWPR